jgi:hypothetical protein
LSNCGRIFRNRVGLTIDFLHCVDMSEKQGDAQLKKEGEKKKAKTAVT